jgi:hypothetical protein
MSPVSPPLRPRERAPGARVVDLPAVVPVLLHSGERLPDDLERLLDGLGDALEGRDSVEYGPSRSVAHVRLRGDGGTGRPGTGTTPDAAL